MTIIRSAGGTFNGTSFTVSLPSLGAASKMVVVAVGNTVINTPSGWTLRASVVNNCGQYWFERTAAGGASTQAFTNSSGAGEWVAYEVAGTYNSATGAETAVAGSTYTSPSHTPPAGATNLLVAAIGEPVSAPVTIQSLSGGFTLDYSNQVQAFDWPVGGGGSQTATATGSAAYSSTVTFSASFGVRGMLIGSYASAATVNHGSASGTVTFTGTAAGHRTPHGASTGAVAFTGTGAGHAPVPAPVADLPGWTHVYVEDFNTPAALGGIWDAYSQEMRGYDGFADTSGNGYYAPDKVLTVHDSMLDYYLHTEGGQHLIASPIPMGYGGLTYGRFSVRYRADQLPGYKIAFLQWPVADDWAQGEIDWPEGNLTGNASPASKQLGNYSSVFAPATQVFAATDQTGWHVATLEWTPTSLTFLWDGQVVGTVTDAAYIPTQPMRWTLQAETEIGGTVPANATAGHVLVDWLSAWTYTPATAPHGAVTGTVAFTGTAAGHKTPHGASTGAVAFTGTGVGHRTPHGASSGAVAFTGTATGQRTPHGAATGTVTFTGGATGHEAPHGASSGTVAFTGTATGHQAPHGAASGTLSVSGTATGHEAPHGAASGSVAFVGVAGGHSPTIGLPHGVATGAVAFTGTAAGHLAPRATSSGAATFTGSGIGHKLAAGAAVAGVAFTGTAAGHAPVVGGAHGSSAGTVAFTGTAAGHRDPHGTSTGSVVFALLPARPAAADLDVTLGVPRGTSLRIGTLTGSPLRLGVPTTRRP